MGKNASVNIRAFALATLVPVGMMIVAMWMKPLWRDEYFSQFFADPGESLSWLLQNRWASDPHPPAYNPLLWVWSQISVHPFWQKCLSLAFLGLGALAALKISRPDQKRRLLIFFLICLGSYWVIYFTTEVRPYVLNFVLSALLTLATVRVFQSEKPSYGLLLTWLVVGMALSLTHYFGALWVACLGFALGLSKLSKGDRKSFVKLGILSMAALIPILLWLQYSYGQIELSSAPARASTGDKFQAGGHQFLRGLVVKTFGSNFLITFLGIGAIWAAILGKKKSDALLIRAAALTVAIAFIIHLFFIDMIKERAFIVIMPALLWVMAGGVAATRHKWGKYLPMVTVVMPFLFIPEYFKNKEKIPELLQAMAPHKAQCQDAPLAVYFRPDPPQEVFSWTSEKLFKSYSGDIVDLSAAPHLSASHLDGTKCPILAVSILLPKNDKAMIEQATRYILDAGYTLEEIELQKFGKGRTLLWLKSTD